MAVLKFDSDEELSVSEEKFLSRLKIEFEHRNPFIKLMVTRKDKAYRMNFKNDFINITKFCKTKESCFAKLKEFRETLSYLTCDNATNDANKIKAHRTAIESLFR
jgi:hypothetical protein